MNRFLVLGTFIILPACGVGIGPKSEKRTDAPYDLSGINAVDVSANDGDVSIAPAQGNGSVQFIKKTPRVSTGSGDCHSESSIQGTTLVVKIWQDLQASCEIDAVIAAPANAAITVNSSDGNVHIQGMTGAVTVNSKDGNIDASLDRPLGDAPVLNAAFTSNDGDVSVSVNFPPATGRLKMSSADGNLKLGLASGTLFQLNEQHEDGNLRSDLTATPGAAFVVDVSTEDGNIRLQQN